MSEQSFVHSGHRHRHRDFVEKLVHGFVQVMEHALDAESISSRPGFLQGLDPRIKLVGLLMLIISVVLAKSLTILVALFLLALVLAFFSHITAARLSKQVWISVLLFTGVIALPSIVIVPGTPLLKIPLVPWNITLQGLRSAAFLVARAETSATFALLLIITTPWTHVLKAMRSLGISVVLVATLGMTHRYIFILLHTATQMFEARRSRVIARMSKPQQRRMVVSAAGVLLSKAFQLSSDVHLAMVSRGYRGDIRLLDGFCTQTHDWFALIIALTVPILILWVQQ